MIRRPAAKARVLRRPAARVRRRPAAEEEEKPEEEVRGEAANSEEVAVKFRRGEAVLSHQLQPGILERGEWIVAEDAIYFQQKAPLAGRVIKEELEGGEREVTVELTGTQNEALLRFATSCKPCHLRVHFCQPACGQKRENPNLAHAPKVKKLGTEVAKTWEANLVETSETPALQAEEEAWRRREEEKNKEKKEVRSSSSSKARKKKKKKKKEKKAKRGEGEEESPEMKRLGGKTVARKTLKELYRGTGLDPDPKRRRKVAKKVKKALKKSKDSASGSSSSTSTSSTDLEEGDLLQDRSKIHRIAALGPGLLAAQCVQGMKQYLTQVTGTGWQAEGDSLPPLLCLYFRTYLANRLAGGVAREMATLAWVGDLLLQARPAEALDGVLQRMKSIEMTSAGTPWTTSQKLELVPPADVAMGSRQEFQIAKKEARLDQEVKGGNPGGEKGKVKGKEKGGKGKEKGKGKAKDAEGKKSS